MTTSTSTRSSNSRTATSSSRRATHGRSMRSPARRATCYGRSAARTRALGWARGRTSTGSTTRSSTPAADHLLTSSHQLRPGGALLRPARNAGAVYDSSRATGRVLWTLGGKNSSFRMRKGTNLYWQHDAQLHPGGLLSLFADGAKPKEESESRALEINVDVHSMRASLKRAYTHSPPLLASAEGNVQLLPNGNVLVGWGTAPAFSDYTPSGKQIRDGLFTPPNDSYRAYRSPWRAQPTSPPAISVDHGTSGQVTVYASWNGA